MKESERTKPQDLHTIRGGGDEKFGLVFPASTTRRCDIKLAGATLDFDEHSGYAICNIIDRQCSDDSERARPFTRLSFKMS